MSYKSKPLPLTFACAATESKLFPSDSGNEIALCGRSNSGKSTLINALANQKKLAKTSNTPGRTQSINFFHLTNDEAKKIVDLPGFGYAKASKQDQNAWAKLILSYLEKRAALTNLILIMDMRHPFQNKDLELAAEDLRMATRHLGSIVGKVDVEEILGSIFKDFCIGK